jgi:MarR family transcriptional regulator, organic hydroperoxide resistance regulator
MDGGEIVGAVSALIRAEHRHAAFVSQAMELPLADMLALYHLANEPLSASALGDRLGLTSGSITALVDRLVDRNLAKRTKHATDRRVVLIEMTKTGHNQSWKLLQNFIGGVIELSQSIPANEQVAVANFLRSLTGLIHDDTQRIKTH